jgi:hypothetical protein
MRRNLFLLCVIDNSRDGSVSIATGYELEGQEVGVRVPVGSRIYISPRRPDWL